MANTLESQEISTPTYLLIRDLAKLAKKHDTNAILICRELRLKDKLFNIYQKREKGKCIALEDKFHLS